MPLPIIREGLCALFGRNWLMDVNLDWKNVPGLNHFGPLPSPASSVPGSTGNQTLDSANYFRLNLDATQARLLY